MTPVPAYPGPAAIFVHEKGDWVPFYIRDSFFCRVMVFASTVEGSSIRSFRLYGCQDGTICISVQFDESEHNRESLYNFLEANQISVRKYGVIDHYCSLPENPEITQKMFRIIANNNQMPASHFTKIQKIVTKGYCSPWQPTDQEKDNNNP